MSKKMQGPPVYLYWQISSQRSTCSHAPQPQLEPPPNSCCSLNCVSRSLISNCNVQPQASCYQCPSWGSDVIIRLSLLARVIDALRMFCMHGRFATRITKDSVFLSFRDNFSSVIAIMKTLWSNDPRAVELGAQPNRGVLFHPSYLRDPNGPDPTPEVFYEEGSKWWSFVYTDVARSHRLSKKQCICELLPDQRIETHMRYSTLLGAS